jgi:nucleotide-binding universal stress UspA family protein
LNHKPFKIIGIGVAFSPNLKANLYEAARLSLLLDSKLLLIHVGDSSEEKKNTIQEILKPFEAKNLNFELVFQAGEPVEVILNTVIKKRIDLLILGALRRENFLKYYLGSIARKITRKAQCSVLMLTNPSVERIPCKHIVVNGLRDDQTEKAIQAAVYVGNALHSEQLTIVEEITQDELSLTVDDDKSLRRVNLMKEKLKRREDLRIQDILNTIPEDDKKTITIKTQPIFGKRGYSIGHYAKVVRADLLVMNAPGKMNFWDRLFPHDLEHILTELPTDLLVIQ